MELLWILVAVVVVIAAWLVMTYNGLIRSRNHVDEAWSDIDVQLKRRYDLIPQLVETVKGYASHEAGVLEKVTALRAEALKAQSTGDVKAIGAANQKLSAALVPFMGYQEQYPDLKANQNFLQLQDELSDTENKIMASRRFYNGNVRDFNNKLQVFPTNMIGGMFGFVVREFFEIEADKEREVPKVKF